MYTLRRNFILAALLCATASAHTGCILSEPDVSSKTPSNTQDNSEAGENAMNSMSPDMAPPALDMKEPVVDTPDMKMAIEPDMKPVDLCADVVCEALDSCHEPGVCDPETGECTYEPKDDGAACEDGDLCTTDDQCVDGVCEAGEAMECVAMDACHDAGTCDPMTGECSNPTKADDTPCDDGDLCTPDDTCQSGVCEAGAEIVCVEPDQCKERGECNPTSGLCEYADKMDGTECDDGDRCTNDDVCMAGACSAGVATECAALSQCHDAGVCDPMTGECSNPTKADATPCDDGDLCTNGDLCRAGTCTAGTPTVCAPLDSCHIAGMCDPSTGMCSNPTKPDNAMCNDGLLCTVGDVCSAGVCMGTPDPLTFVDAGATAVGSGATIGGELAQSFTTGATSGHVTGIYLWRNGYNPGGAASPLQVKFFDGEARSGRPLYDQPLLLPQINQRVRVDIPNGPLLLANTQYSLVVAGSSDFNSGISLSLSTDSHAGGKFFYDQFYGTSNTSKNIDLRFEIEIQETCP